MIKNEFCSATQSLELKKLGYREPCIGYFYCGTLYPHHQKTKNFVEVYEATIDRVQAPLKQQAIRWFEEKKGLSITKTLSSVSYDDRMSIIIDEMIKLCKNK